MVTEVKNLNNKIAEMELTIQHLNDQLTWFRRQMFGMKSERVTDFPCNTPDLPGFDFGNAEIEILPKSHIKPHDRKNSKSRKGEFKLEVGENVEVVEKVIDIPEVDKIDPVTGKKLVCIGYDKSDKLATKPEQHYILRTLRPKYTLKEDSLYGIVQAKADDSIIEGSKFDVSLWLMLYVINSAITCRFTELLKNSNIKILVYLVNHLHLL